MSFRHRSIVALFILICAALLVAPAAAQDEDPIVIATSLPLTGDLSINGTRHLQGYQLCIDLINENGGLLGRPVELLYEDNRSEVEPAIAHHERFINVDGVDLLFATYSSRLTFPTSSVAAQYNYVLPIPGGAALRIYEQGFDNLFYFQPLPAEYVGQTPIRALQDLVPAEDLPKTAAVIHADDFFANSIVNGLLGGDVLAPDGSVVTTLPSLVEEAGMELVYNETYPGEGFSDWLTLANSLRRANAEMLFAATASAEEVIQLTRAMQTVGYQPKMVYFSQGTQPEFVEGVGEAANGIIMHTGWHPNANWVGLLGSMEFSNSDFVAAYQEAFEGEPDEDVSIPFAVCQGMTQAVEAVGSTDNQAIKEWLHSRTPEEPVRTILGDFVFDERGLAVDRTFLMIQYQDEQIEIVYPVGEFEGTKDLIYPRPEW